MAPVQTPAKILIVDDEPAIRELIHRFLSQDYQMESAEDGQSALAKFERFNPDLAILDVNLPDTTGFQLCKEMQSRTNVFVLMLTSRGDEADIIEAFRMGADDYVTKPFALRVLKARVRAILKRTRFPTVKPSVPQNLEFGELNIDTIEREVTLNKELVHFTPIEFNLLHFLASHPNRVWKKTELLQEVWNYDYIGDPHVVSVHINNIRGKLGKKHSRIKTVQGVGYKFIPEQDPGEPAIEPTPSPTHP